VYALIYLHLTQIIFNYLSVYFQRIIIKGIFIFIIINHVFLLIQQFLISVKIKFYLKLKINTYILSIQTKLQVIVVFIISSVIIDDYILTM